MLLRYCCSFFVAALLISDVVKPASAEEIPDSLMKYVQRMEPVFDWQAIETLQTREGTIHRLQLTSQTWQEIVWKHALTVYEPAEVLHPEHMLLFVTGGRNGQTPGEDDLKRGLTLAKLCGARVATLHQVPNQPLLGDRVEDDLITETWLKYLETGDESWPLLFPMVKSAVQAITALQEFSEEQWQQPVKGFVITGASKRGWTSWLTPVADSRVIATAPIVIDTLNFPAQMDHQLATWGKYSEQIDDYTRKGLVKAVDEPRTPREDRLWKVMDPYTYREQLTLPKLLINGANDRYWVADALKNYWPDLKGPKNVLMIPNAGHGLDGGQEQAMTTLGVFFRRVAASQRLPNLQWQCDQSDGQLQLTVWSETPAESGQLWIAKSDTRDFRESEWIAYPLPRSEHHFEGSLDVSEKDNIALFGELMFEHQGLRYSLTTQVFVNE